MPHAIRVMQHAANNLVDIEIEYGACGGCSIDEHGTPLSDQVLEQARDSDAIVLGAVGGPQWDHLSVDQKPEKGLLELRADLDCFANLRPALTFDSLAAASTLKTSIVSRLDILIVRELVGGIYFGQPRGIEVQGNRRRAFNTLVYDETEIARIAKVAFELARKRNKKVCSIDKANVLESSILWREIVTEVQKDFPDVELTHMYVDNAAMQLVRNPKYFDVLVTGNMFGDILSDLAAMLTGSLGMLPSASLNASGVGLYEPVHGSAPDIAGQNIANPLATVLSLAMMFRYSFNQPSVADQIESAIDRVLQRGIRTQDISSEDDQDELVVGTDAMAEAVIEELH